ncbi:energy transducer TonB [Fortiea sp. LEGE XX443]|uniref:energy transducer TonB n=1 Tax=Fortiea sp. LEGE XX443 TaxID=1828611 RepID=UPI001881159A|nr:energy transducer TonB [Fortiea sp. LEGE XX443]MBE9007613.1 energy transducer TonB [Fortiea sp. LEGE XX443]
MSFSSIAVEQRSKEAQALKLFLGYSLVGSLALHIVLLASGIGNFLARVPTEEEPIEILIADTPAPEIEKVLIEEKKELPDKVVSRTPEKLLVIPQKQSIAPAPVQKLVERPQIQPVQRQPKPAIQPYKPSTSASNPIVSNTVTPSSKTTQTSTGTGGGSGSSSSSELTSTGNSGGLGSSGGPRILTGTGIGIGSGNGTGTGSGTGSGTGNGTGSGNPVAVAPKPPKIEAPSNRVNDNNGRAACRQCDSKYPERARRRGVEGKVGVAVDTDANGNVTNVRLTRSSGSRDLDEAHLRQAREWKLKPSEGGRQGVSIETDYAMRGSRRYREAQERKRQRQAREAEQRNQPTATANQTSTTETPRRRRRLTSGTIVDVPPEPRQRRESASASENTPLRRQLRQRINNNNNNTPQPRPSQAATSSGENNSPGVSRRRRRRPDSAATSNSTSKLRNALRRSRQQSESAPAAPSSEPKNE